MTCKSYFTSKSISSQKYRIDTSQIHGSGIFANKNIKKGEFIGIPLKLIFGFFISISEDLGLYINHSWAPNAHIIKHGWEWHLIAMKNIKKNDEIFINYNDTPWFIKKPLDTYK